MPSPLGHSIIGATIGIAFYVSSGTRMGIWCLLKKHKVPLLAAIGLANSPDLDYVPGLFVGNWNLYHQQMTHSIGWTLILSLGLWIGVRVFYEGVDRKALLFILVVLSSHLIADFFNTDMSSPYGMMLLWPFSETYYTSPVPVFSSLHKHTWEDLAQWRNVRACMYETVWTVPWLVLLLLAKRTRHTCSEE